MLLLNLLPKFCNGCQKWLQRQHFAYCASKGDKLMPRCRSCRAVSGKTWFEANREHKLADAREYKRTHRAGKKAVDAVWRANNREKWNAISRAWYKANPDKAKEIVARWTKANPEKVQAKIQLRRGRVRAQRKGSLSLRVTEVEWQGRKAVFGNCCAYCGKPESKTNKLAKDHVKPIALGGAHALSNLRPACRSCNSRKQDKSPAEWFALHGIAYKRNFQDQI